MCCLSSFRGWLPAFRFGASALGRLSLAELAVLQRSSLCVVTVRIPLMPCIIQKAYTQACDAFPVLNIEIPSSVHGLLLNWTDDSMLPGNEDKCHEDFSYKTGLLILQKPTSTSTPGCGQCCVGCMTYTWAVCKDRALPVWPLIVKSW